jgi:predicted dehydrogenase
MGRVQDNVADSGGTPIRIVQVGLGGFGLGWAGDVLPTNPNVELVGAVDINPEALTSVCARTSLGAERCFSSLDEALESSDADAVLVTASLPVHVPAALTALAAGKHVMVEKPFAPGLEDAQAAVDLAAQQGLVMMVSQNYRFFPAVRAVAELVRSEEYGPVDSVNVDFRRYDNSAPRGGHRHYHFPQPMLVDMAIHHFDLMRLVLGREPKEVYCQSWNPPWSKYDEPAAADAIIRFEGDIMVSYRGNWLSAGPETAWAGAWRMELSGAEIAWTSREGKPIESADAVTVRPLGGEPKPIDLPHVRYIDRAGSLEAFVRAIRTGEEPETSGRHNLKTLALTLATVESATTGAPVLL